MHKLLILITLLFLLNNVVGEEYTECAYQEVCIGEVLRDRVVIDYGDTYEVCEDCSCIVTTTDTQGRIIENNQSMTYIDGGYYGYTISSSYYFDNKYTGYIYCYSSGFEEVGHGCVDFVVLDCKDDTVVTASKDDSVSIEEIIEIQEEEEKEYGLSDYPALFKLFFKGVGGSAAIILLWLPEKIWDILQFLSNPFVFTSTIIYPYLKDVFISITQISFFAFLLIELIIFISACSESKGVGDLVLKFVNKNEVLIRRVIEYTRFFVEMLNTIFMFFVKIIELILSALNVVVPW